MKSNNSNNSSAGVIGVLLAIAIIAVFVIPLAIYFCWSAAFVLTYLWAWFVMPVFGLAALTLPQAFGLSLLVGFVTYNHVSHYDKDERDWQTKAVEILVLMARPWLVLLAGYICKAWFM